MHVCPVLECVRTFIHVSVLWSTHRYLKLPFAPGLAKEGKRILLEIMARVDKMQKTEPTTHKLVRPYSIVRGRTCM